MQRLRTWMTATLVWFFIFYSVERLHAPLNISSFVYLYATLLAIIPLIFRPLGGVALSYVAIAAGLLLLLGKSLLQYPIFHAHLPITVTEYSACLIALALGQKLSGQILAFEHAMTEFIVPNQTGVVTDFGVGQQLIYREIQRARHFERPLVMVAIAPEEASAAHCSSALLEELCRSLQRRHLDARISKVAGSELRDCDVLCRRDDHFVLVLPESTPAEAAFTVERIVERVRSKLGVELRWGLSEFPGEEVTFAGLLDRVEQQISSGAGSRERAEPFSRPAAAGSCTLEADHASL